MGFRGSAIFKGIFHKKGQALRRGKPPIPGCYLGVILHKEDRGKMLRAVKIWLLDLGGEKLIDASDGYCEHPSFLSA